MLAQEVESTEEELEGLFAKSDDEAQNDKAEDAAEEVEEVEADEGEEEGAVPRRVLPDPGQPTQSQLEDHRIDHYPFRSWCPGCVAGRATGEQHRARKGDRAVPVVSFDDMFITKSLEVVRSFSEGGEVLFKILVATASIGKAVTSRGLAKTGTRCSAWLGMSVGWGTFG